MTAANLFPGNCLPLCQGCDGWNWSGLENQIQSSIILQYLKGSILIWPLGPRPISTTSTITALTMWEALKTRWLYSSLEPQTSITFFKRNPSCDDRPYKVHLYTHSNQGSSSVQHISPCYILNTGVTWCKRVAFKEISGQSVHYDDNNMSKFCIHGSYQSLLCHGNHSVRPEVYWNRLDGRSIYPEIKKQIKGILIKKHLKNGHRHIDHEKRGTAYLQRAPNDLPILPLYGLLYSSYLQYSRWWNYRSWGTRVKKMSLSWSCDSAGPYKLVLRPEHRQRRGGHRLPHT